MFRKLIHYSFDAVLISALLAGISRSTGLYLRTDKIKSKDLRGYLERYLGIGEWALDYSIMLLSQSAYFDKKRN